ncbi:MAG: response regulator [Trichlorobacter sp.]|uniref:response regulator n=1 Tax=Trichlorobacter sp. TaxID=2911007 RepID=UPI00255D3695|nr:response regulator [Trichlorobacter sp.]MDK9716968.1 response regulator [Trichlorobacter sp.]
MSDTLHILCVDDEEHILKTLERFCHNEGVTMLAASSAAEALNILENKPVNIIISDYQMPETDGLAFLDEVSNRWPETIRIILSGFIETSAVTRALEQGRIFGFLPKPWQRSELKNMIQTASAQYKTNMCSKVTPS